MNDTAPLIKVEKKSAEGRQTASLIQQRRLRYAEKEKKEGKNVSRVRR